MADVRDQEDAFRFNNFDVKVRFELGPLYHPSPRSGDARAAMARLGATTAVPAAQISSCGRTTGSGRHGAPTQWAESGRWKLSQIRLFLMCPLKPGGMGVAWQVFTIYLWTLFLVTPQKLRRDRRLRGRSLPLSHLVTLSNTEFVKNTPPFTR